MELKILTPSYLDGTEMKTLRHELCEIVFHKYKGAGFHYDHELIEKHNVLHNILRFIKNHPDIYNYKENSLYWYPYKTVDGSKYLPLHNDFYPNLDNTTTFFNKDGLEIGNTDYDYLFDPVKLHFFIMCQDIKKLGGSYESNDIIEINHEIFKILFDIIGDTISYNGLNNLEHFRIYIQDHLDGEKKVKNNPETSQEQKNILVLTYSHFNNSSYLVNIHDIITICHEHKLQKELLDKPKNNTVRNKI